MISSDRRRRRRAVNGEQLLALGARRAKAGRPKEDGVGRTAVVVLVAGASPPAVGSSGGAITISIRELAKAAASISGHK